MQKRIRTINRALYPYKVTTLNALGNDWRWWYMGVRRIVEVHVEGRKWNRYTMADRRQA